MASLRVGDLATYGDVARAAGSNAPRAVGRVLAEAGDSLPRHRVVPASGVLAPHLVDEQARRLRAEGHRVDGGRLRVPRVDAERPGRDS